MNDALKARLDAAFGLTEDLFRHLDAATLQRDMPALPSNRLADQVWCIVGGRESYMRAIEAGGWQGFSCGLTEPAAKPAVLSALQDTRSRLAHLDFAKLTPDTIHLAFDLLEHEVQHHGQLIRYVYGNRLTFPDSWNKRYTV